MKKIISLLLAFMMMFSVFAITTNAAAEGTMMSNAVEAQFGVQDMKIWTKNTDHLNHYVAINIEQQGIVTINATKPFDDEGEYGRLHFTLYDELGDPIWGNDCYKSVEDAKDFYNVKVGLAPGRYYLTLKPGFTVRTGIIETYYTLDFAPNAYCEVEPNNAGYEALQVNLGQKYTGYFCSAGSDYEEADYYKLPVVAGRKYRVTWYNWSKLSQTTTIIKFLDPSGEDHYLSFSKKIDSQGLGYCEFTAEESGIGYLYIYNCNGAQVEYGFVITDVTNDGKENNKTTVKTQQKPKKTSISKITAKKKSLKIKIKKRSGVTGYEIQYSLKKNFKSAKKKTVKKASTTSLTIKSLKAKKAYYVRVRTYKTVGGKKYYSAWSKAVKKKTK